MILGMHAMGIAKALIAKGAKMSIEEVEKIIAAG
jgi:hypothetical protein